MKASACLAVVIAVVVIQMVNASGDGPVIHTASDPRDCPRCDVVCLNGSVDKDKTIGCPPCECPPTCANFNCSMDEKCVLKQFICVRAPCYPLPNCVPINETATATPGNSSVDVLQCRHDVTACMVGCERVVGPDGCPICECQTNCSAVTCPFGYECKMAVVTCFKASCPESHAICVPKENTTHCLVYTCAKGCVHATGPDGCPFCKCPPTCKEINCSKDEECILKPLIDCGPTCFSPSVCVPTNVSCTGTPNTDECGKPTDKWFYNESTHSCQSFRYSGCTPSPNTFQSLVDCNNKCWDPEVCGHCGDDCFTFKKFGEPPKCICPDPCKGVKCTEGEVCSLLEAVCIKEPCELRLEPYCYQNRCPEQEPCNIRCAYGLKTDGNGCPLCKCCDERTPT